MLSAPSADLSMVSAMLSSLIRFNILVLGIKLRSHSLLQGQIALIATAAEVWGAAPQRAAQAIDRLMAHRLVDGSAVVRWAFGCLGLLSLDDQIANGLAWEALYNAVNKTLARTQVRQSDILSAFSKACWRKSWSLNEHSIPGRQAKFGHLMIQFSHPAALNLYSSYSYLLLASS